MIADVQPADAEPLRFLLARWRDDPGGTYRTWFLWDQRLKNFRSIRRGIGAVVGEIEAGTFGNAYRGSSLETVVRSVAEQRQIFRGADHAFLWKPKLRIPDIYEDSGNQLAFARFLDACACCADEHQLLAAIQVLESRRIKGVGPAAANLLYFLHPTLAPPFNTAIVRGYNSVTGARVRLGRWDEYLAMRRGILGMNERFRDLLSNDLGAISGFLFDVGSGRYGELPRPADTDALAAWKADLLVVREQAARADAAATAARDGERTHTEVQGWLRELGLRLGFGVWIASNDRSRAYGGGRLSDGCLDRLPRAVEATGAADTVRLIDVLWVDPDGERIAAAFEVEHTTSIHSGIVRMLDLALAVPTTSSVSALFLVAPDAREEEVRAQLRRPAFSRVGELCPRFLPYGELAEHREAMARFGHGLGAIEAIARRLV
jgi:type II restriction enzyme